MSPSKTSDESIFTARRYRGPTIIAPAANPTSSGDNRVLAADTERVSSLQLAEPNCLDDARSYLAATLGGTQRSTKRQLNRDHVAGHTSVAGVLGTGRGMPDDSNAWSPLGRYLARPSLNRSVSPSYPSCAMG